MFEALKKRLLVMLNKHRHQLMLGRCATFIQQRFLFIEKILFKGITNKNKNKMRHSLTFLARMKRDTTKRTASMTIALFLAETQRLKQLKNMAVLKVAKCKQIQSRGKKIFCMNKIRMCILIDMWNE